jgi:hypothetical protein
MLSQGMAILNKKLFKEQLLILIRALTEFVEIRIFDHVFDVNFCCEALIAKASNLFSTCQ